MRLLPRRRREPEEPTGVRIVRPGLPDIECDMLREPSQDRKGCAAWVAVPRTGERITLRNGVDFPVIGFLPGKTIVSFDIDFAS